MARNTIVLGLGNPLMSDEGVGIKIIERFISASADFPEADFIDAGTGGMTLLHYISDRKKAVIVDCAMMDLQPGDIKRFTYEQVKSVKKLAHLSLHEADILKVIELAKRLGDCPPEIVFFGVEPETIEPNIGLSGSVSARLDEYIAMIAEELKRG